jgi:predicted metal-dependent hydrolase
LGRASGATKRRGYLRIVSCGLPTAPALLTKWGSCNHSARHIRLNTGLVKKPKDLLEYVVVHEMLHLVEPMHSTRFVALLTQHYPTWREARNELNELPLTS